MKIKFLSITFLITISIGYLFLSSSKTQDIDLNELFSLSIAHAEDPPIDDEKNITMCGNCDDGTTCECTACMRGFIDCSPSCPCCPEDN